MWQLLLTAAVAGSTSLVAKHLLNNLPYSRLTQTPPPPPPAGGCQDPADSAFRTSLPFPHCNNHCEHGTGCDHQQRESIFRFSSSGSSGSKKKQQKKTRDLSRKSGVCCRRLKYRSGGNADATATKKRRKRGSFASSRGCSVDGSLFGWGLGVGIIYMMSAGKAEIKKLNNAMDETSKVVQELRAELYKRKFDQFGSSSKRVMSGQVATTADVKSGCVTVVDDVDCPSSVLTDEPEAGMQEMDQLEAELESELLKLPLSDAEASGNDALMPNMAKDEEVSVSYQCQGVAPSELDQKLCHLLIEQQENQIVELESELNSAQSKLHEKEAELQALKDCVRRLTEFSLSPVSDDENNVKEDQEGTGGEWDNSSKMESESRKSVAGMKRPMSSE